jgi:hypothetical protein
LSGYASTGFAQAIPDKVLELGTMTTTAENPAAGWYPASPGSVEQRYWNGQVWTDFYYPPRPGQQLTAEQAAQSSGNAPVAAPTPHTVRAKKPRRKLVIVLSAVAVVAVAAAAAIVVTTGGTTAPAITNGYQYLPAMHIKAGQEITLPATYDMAAKLKSLGGKTDQGTPGYSDKVIGVYSDPQFTSDADVNIVDVFDNKQISIEPGESDEAEFADNTVNEKDYGMGILGGNTWLNRKTTGDGQTQTPTWGLFKTYYIVQRYSPSGAKLKYPTVTPVIPSGTTLATPRVTVSPTPGNPSSITFRWNKVKGATNYVILSDSASVENGLTVVATTSGSATSWDSADASNMTEFENHEVPIYQNEGFSTFGESSADDQQSGYFNSFKTTGVLYGVMALKGHHDYSSMGSVNSAIAAALPSINARNADRDFERQIPDSGVTSISQLPLLFPYTSLDGNTRQTRGILQPGFATPTSGGWDLFLQGAGVQLGVAIRLNSAAGIAPDAFIASYNAASLKATPKTGTPTSPILARAAQNGSEKSASTTAPDLGFPVFGGDPLTKYLAANMIAHRASVNISKYENDDINGALDEAIAQNPYIMDLTGESISPDGTTIYFSYGFNSADTTTLQKSVQAKVKSVVASVTNSSMSSTAKVSALNKWMTENVKYNYPAFAALDADIAVGLGGYPDGFVSAWTPDGALLHGSAVCGGFANAFDLLSNAAGVPTVVVTGTVAIGGGHAWNKVDIDGNWKAVDTTWDTGTGAPTKYLLINDDQFTGVATRSEGPGWMPAQVQAQYATAK